MRLDYIDDLCAGLCSQDSTGSFKPSHMPNKGDKEEEDEEEDDEEQGEPPCAIREPCHSTSFTQSIRDMPV